MVNIINFVKQGSLWFLSLKENQIERFWITMLVISTLTSSFKKKKIIPLLFNAQFDLHRHRSCSCFFFRPIIFFQSEWNYFTFTGETRQLKTVQVGDHEWWKLYFWYGVCGILLADKIQIYILVQKPKMRSPRRLAGVREPNLTLPLCATFLQLCPGVGLGWVLPQARSGPV